MHGDQRRRCTLRQVEVALELDVVDVGAKVEVIIRGHNTVARLSRPIRRAMSITFFMPPRKVGADYAARWQSTFHVLEQWTGIEKRLQRGRHKIMREC